MRVRVQPVRGRRKSSRLGFHPNNNPADRTSFAPRAFLSECKSAGLPATSIQITPEGRRKQLRIFSFFWYFSFFFIRNKRERKVHLRNIFYFKIFLHFLFFIAKKEKKTKQKKRNNALFFTTLRLWIEWL